MSNRPITIVTGARKGIGQFLAQHYVKQGHYVIGCSRQAALWSEEGYCHFQADISDERQVRRLFREIQSKFGRLDNLVNNAGIASMNHSLLTPFSTFESIMKTNVSGAFLMARESAKLMSKNGYGRIVNFTTVAVPLKLDGELAYVSSKSAVETMTSVFAREIASFGITVNAIGPAPTMTDLLAAVPDAKIAQLIDRQAIKRLGKFEDIANVCDFFIRPESSFVTGQIVYLGGV
jgi:3-oxoacyl-[acyl-carrier protein] reductase